MQKAQINTPIGNRRKKIAGTYQRKGSVPTRKGIALEKIIDEKKNAARRGRITGRLIASMNLDEMLEASKIAEMGIRGEKIPSVKSLKVQKYVEEILRLNKRASTKLAAKKMQQDLTVQIIEKNKKTTNAAEARRLYKELMEEE